MKYYETLYIINPNLADDDYVNVVTKFNSLVEKNNGVVIKADEWGKKSMAYEIKKFDKGYYVLLQYCGEPGITAELKRDLKLDERIIKYQTIKLSDHADPEALKAKIEESEAVAGKEAELSDEVNTEEKGKEEINQEGENGLQ